MKYYEYGVRTLESKGAVGGFGDESNKWWEGVTDSLTRLGIEGWEIYQVIEKNDVTHFLMRREITQDEARKIHVEEGIGGKYSRLGFVDHPPQGSYKG